VGQDQERNEMAVRLEQERNAQVNTLISLLG